MILFDLGIFAQAKPAEHDIRRFNRGLATNDICYS
jgi:hypothetical protein